MLDDLIQKKVGCRKIERSVNILYRGFSQIVKLRKFAMMEAWIYNRELWIYNELIFHRFLMYKPCPQ